MQNSDSAGNSSLPHTEAGQQSVGSENDSMNDILQVNHMSSNAEIVVNSPSETSPSNFDQNPSQSELTTEVKNEIGTSSNQWRAGRGGGGPWPPAKIFRGHQTTSGR